MPSLDYIARAIQTFLINNQCYLLRTFSPADGLTIILVSFAGKNRLLNTLISGHRFHNGGGWRALVS